MANEIKRVYFNSQASPVASGNVEDGTYTLTFDGQTTASIAYNADAATITTELEALSNIGVGDVSVSLTANGFTIEFVNALANTNVGDLSCTPSLKQKADTVSAVTTTSGVAPVNEVQRVDLGGATTGTYSVNATTVNGLTLTDLQNALNTFFGSGNTNATDNFNGTFDVEFIGSNAGQDISQMSVNNIDTDGSPSGSTITTGSAGTAQIVTVTIPDVPTEGNLHVTIGAETSSDFLYSDNTPLGITGWTGGGSAGNWTYTRNSPAANEGTVSGAEGSTPLRKSCAMEPVTTQEGSAGGGGGGTSKNLLLMGVG